MMYRYPFRYGNVELEILEILKKTPSLTVKEIWGEMESKTISKASIDMAVLRLVRKGRIFPSGTKGKRKAYTYTVIPNDGSEKLY